MLYITYLRVFTAFRMQTRTHMQSLLISLTNTHIRRNPRLVVPQHSHCSGASTQGSVIADFKLGRGRGQIVQGLGTPRAMPPWPYICAWYHQRTASTSSSTASMLQCLSQRVLGQPDALHEGACAVDQFDQEAVTELLYSTCRGVNGVARDLSPIHDVPVHIIVWVLALLCHAEHVYHKY